jgi:hypothetical protein
MAAPKRKSKHAHSDFDFEGFLRSGPDSGMETAVVSMLRRAEDDRNAVLDRVDTASPAPNLDPELNTDSGPKLTPAVEQEETERRVFPAPTPTGAPSLEAEVIPSHEAPAEAIKLEPGPKLGSGPSLGPDTRLTGEVSLAAGLVMSLEPLGTLNGTPLPASTPADETKSGLNLRPGPKLPPVPTLNPGLRLAVSANTTAPKKRQFPIREMKLAQDAHTRAEQYVYEYLWETARCLDEVSRVITIGFGVMARMVRLSESNARINTRSLIGKLAIEEYGDYDCERSLGRTYRVFNYSEILKRRRAAGLMWYMRRTLAVVFVDPTTGQPINTDGRKEGIGAKGSNLGARSDLSPGLTLTPPPGPNLSPEAGVNLAPDPGSKLGDEPGVKLTLPYREISRESTDRTTSSPVSALRQILAEYGPVDDDAVTLLETSVHQVRPDATVPEMLHFIRIKGNVIRKRGSAIDNPIGFLLASVPKCFEGESFRQFRQGHRGSQQQGREAQQSPESEIEEWRKRNQAILNDPEASEQEKGLARTALAQS